MTKKIFIFLMLFGLMFSSLFAWDYVKEMKKYLAKNPHALPEIVEALNSKQLAVGMNWEEAYLVGRALTRYKVMLYWEEPKVGKTTFVDENRKTVTRADFYFELEEKSQYIQDSTGRIVGTVSKPKFVAQPPVLSLFFEGLFLVKWEIHETVR